MRDACQVNPLKTYQDTDRSSAVFGAFLFIGTFFFATINAFRPKLAGLTMFATIILDVQCSYAPGKSLLAARKRVSDKYPSVSPSANYTIPKVLLIPSGIFVAIAIATLVLIFPESLNHIWLYVPHR